MCEVQRVRTSLVVQCWGYGFDSSSGKIPDAAGQLKCSSTFMPTPCSQFLPVLLPTVDGIYQDLFTGETIYPHNVPLKPWQYRWIKKVHL